MNQSSKGKKWGEKKKTALVAGRRSGKSTRGQRGETKKSGEGDLRYFKSEKKENWGLGGTEVESWGERGLSK